MTDEDAIEHARRVAVERGWPWEGPFHVSRERSGIVAGRAQARVRSNASSRGQNVIVVIDDATGELVSANMLPR